MRISYLKFDLTSALGAGGTGNSANSAVASTHAGVSTSAGIPTSAYFELSSKMSTNNDEGATLTFDIYGLADTSWSESDITWENSPNHQADNHEVTGLGETATHITTMTMSGLGETKTYQVDISEYVETMVATGTGEFTLMIVDSLVQDGNVDFYSKERSKESLRPYLYVVQ